MSYVLPQVPRFMHVHAPKHTPHPRVRDVRCQHDDSAVLGWRWQAVYSPRKRSLLERLRIRWKVQLRLWGYA